MTRKQEIQKACKEQRPAVGDYSFTKGAEWADENLEKRLKFVERINLIILVVLIILLVKII